MTALHGACKYTSAYMCGNELLGARDTKKQPLIFFFFLQDRRDIAGAEEAAEEEKPGR